MMSKVARNDASEAINNIIDAVSRHLQDNVELQKKIYSMTLDTLKTQNEKLWHTICLRLGKVYLEQHNYRQLDDLLAMLKNSCRKSASDQVMSGGSGAEA
jgi:transcriptional regulator NrdR family protein